MRSLLGPVARRLRARAGMATILAEIGRVLGAAARDVDNLAPRRCPVCGATAVEPRPALRGPVLDFHRCRDCGMLYAPRVLRPEVVAELWLRTDLRRAYLERMRDDARAAAGRRVHAALVAELAARAPGRRAAVDVGCGFGQLAAELAGRFDEVIALELDRAIAAAGAALHGIAIRSERLQDLERAPGSVDLITMNQILEHIDEPRPLLAAARRLLSRDGVLWVSVPHGASLGLAVLRGRHPHVATHMHVNLFTKDTIRALIEAHGFRVAGARTDDDPGLSLVDFTVRAATPPLLAAPAFAADKGVRWLAARSHAPSRLGRGAHLDVMARAE